MSINRSMWRVEVTFITSPPTREVARASGVSEVRVEGHKLHCVVAGSFQPFLEALRGREVVGLTSIPHADPRERDQPGGDH